MLLLVPLMQGLLALLLPCVQVAQMLCGEAAPWEAGGQRSGLELVLGRKYFMAKNDLQRCEEQLKALVTERSRLDSYFQATAEKVNAAIAQFGELDFDVPPTKFTVSHGRLFWLRQHAKALQAQRGMKRRGCCMPFRRHWYWGLHNSLLGEMFCL